MNQAATHPRPKRLRIVLLDDEKFMLQLLELYLREWINEVDLIPFQNGDDAWRELSRMEPDLLITDWRHPGLDGGELLQKLAEKQMKVPVLMITAHDMEYVREYAVLGVKIAFLQKPFGVEKFWRTIDALIGPCDNPPRIPEYLK
jgi:two-component system response regulator YesN